jgi:REP element-mobilizing transposase RayT
VSGQPLAPTRHDMAATNESRLWARPASSSMARKIRIEFPGAAYQLRAIYEDALDRKVWLETLGEACEKTGWRIHAWVMMSNHYHLLLETPEANLVAGMKWLQGTYTQRYNSRHELFGHLFQGRYKALVVDAADGNYFGVVSTYISSESGASKVDQDWPGSVGALPVEQLPLLFERATAAAGMARHRPRHGRFGTGDLRSGRI